MKRILLILPEQLLDMATEAAESLQLSRLAFIRQAIFRSLAIHHRTEKPIMDSLFQHRRIPDLWRDDN